LQTIVFDDGFNSCSEYRRNLSLQLFPVRDTEYSGTSQPMRHVCSGQTAHEFAYTQILLRKYLTANVTFRFGEEIQLIEQLDGHLRRGRSVLNSG
jgi:hypothetical protein